MITIDTSGYGVLVRDEPVCCLELVLDDGPIGLLCARMGRPRASIAYLDSEDELHHERVPVSAISMVAKRGGRNVKNKTPK